MVLWFPIRLPFSGMKGVSYRVKVQVRSNCFLQRCSELGPWVEEGGGALLGKGQQVE